MNQEIQLMNFRISLGLKSQFEESCQRLRTNMTAELNRMIRNFVRDSKDLIDDPIPFVASSQDDWS